MSSLLLQTRVANAGDDGKNATMDIITLVLLIAIVLGVCTRLGMKLVISPAFEIDDLLIILAMFFGVAQSIAVLIQSLNGLGRHLVTLGPTQLIAFQKAGYSSNILFVITMGMTKLSVLFLLRQLSASDRQRRMLWIPIAVMIAWTFASFWGAAFECHTPHTWEFLGSKCFDRVAFWEAYGVLNILTEVFLIGAPLYMFLQVHAMKNKRKIVLIGCFSSRIIVIAAVICELVYLNHTRRSSDLTFDLWRSALSTQLVQCASILTACIPHMRIFYINSESGMIRADDLRRRAKKTSAFGNWSGSSSGKHSGGSSSLWRAKSRPQPPAPHPEAHDMNRLLSRNDTPLDSTAGMAKPTVTNDSGHGDVEDGTIESAPSEPELAHTTTR